MAPPVTDAIDLVEDVLLPALASTAPLVVWDPAPADVERRLALPATDAQALERVVIGQHQDGGGRRNIHLHSNGWEGLVTIRVRSRSRASARAGLALIVTAMAGLSSPAGYAFHAVWQRPLALPTLNLVYSRAGIWRITIRRTS